MGMEQAATFLAASILLTIGFIVIILGIVVVNNVIHKYWKPVKVFTPESWTAFNPPIVINDKRDEVKHNV